MACCSRWLYPRSCMHACVHAAYHLACWQGAGPSSPLRINLAWHVLRGVAQHYRNGSQPAWTWDARRHLYYYRDSQSDQLITQMDSVCPDLPRYRGRSMSNKGLPESPGAAVQYRPTTAPTRLPAQAISLRAQVFPFSLLPLNFPPSDP